MCLVTTQLTLFPDSYLGFIFSFVIHFPVRSSKCISSAAFAQVAIRHYFIFLVIDARVRGTGDVVNGIKSD